jgi:hypothetical protein
LLAEVVDGDENAGDLAPDGVMTGSAFRVDFITVSISRLVHRDD